MWPPHLKVLVELVEHERHVVHQAGEVCEMDER